MLNALLFAASTYQESRDPAQEINNYLVSNGIVPPNIREDSRQPDVWRDYQQLLPELGLIRSTRREKIQLNPVGLSFLDGGIGFTDLVTIQAFRWQYPNGQHTQRSPRDPSSESFGRQQAEAGILIKPAVLIWQVLDELKTDPKEAWLTAAEIEHFLIPANNHQAVDSILRAVRSSRRSRTNFPPGPTRQRRNASDWMRRLAQTHAFDFTSGDLIAFSDYSLKNRAELRIFMAFLTQPETFWSYPTTGSPSDSWSLWYGTFDSAQYPVPNRTASDDYGSEAEPEEDRSESNRVMKPSPFSWAPTTPNFSSDGATISSAYTADLSNSAHRLHDTMVRLIAEVCHRKRARVFSDPTTLDLLVEFGDQELLIEVKSATTQNIAHKVRLALGQVTYYEYLRSKQTEKPRRRGVALTLAVQPDHWSKSFLTDYLDVDLITLRAGQLLTYSQSTEVSTLLS